MRSPDSLELICTSPNWPSDGSGLHGRLVYGRKPRGVNIVPGFSRDLSIQNIERGLFLDGWAECGELMLWCGGREGWTDEKKRQAEALARDLVGKRGSFRWVTLAEREREIDVRMQRNLYGEADAP